MKEKKVSDEQKYHLSSRSRVVMFKWVYFLGSEWSAKSAQGIWQHEFKIPRENFCQCSRSVWKLDSKVACTWGSLKLFCLAVTWVLDRWLIFPVVIAQQSEVWSSIARWQRLQAICRYLAYFCWWVSDSDSLFLLSLACEVQCFENFEVWLCCSVFGCSSQPNPPGFKIQTSSIEVLSIVTVFWTCRDCRVPSSSVTIKSFCTMLSAWNVICAIAWANPMTHQLIGLATITCNQTSISWRNTKPTCCCARPIFWFWFWQPSPRSSSHSRRNTNSLNNTSIQPVATFCLVKLLLVWIAPAIPWSRFPTQLHTFKDIDSQVKYHFADNSISEHGPLDQIWLTTCWKQRIVRDAFHPANQ